MGLAGEKQLFGFGGADLVHLLRSHSALFEKCHFHGGEEAVRVAFDGGEGGGVESEAAEHVFDPFHDILLVWFPFLNLKVL